LPEPVARHADCDEDGDVAHLAGPTPLEDHAIEVDVRKLSGDLPVTPGLDVLVDLLVWPFLSSGATPAPSDDAPLGLLE
jgi:hypothetical protein